MSLPSAIDVNIPRVDIVIDDAEGEFQLSMGVFTDNTYTTSITGDEVFVVPDMINVGVRLEGNPSSQFKLQMKKCWATPR